MADRKQQILELASLARLGLSAREVDRFAPQLDEVVECLGILASVDVSEVEQWSFGGAAAPHRTDEPSDVQPDRVLDGVPALLDGSVDVPGFGKG